MRSVAQTTVVWTGGLLATNSLCKKNKSKDQHAQYIPLPRSPRIVPKDNFSAVFEMNPIFRPESLVRREATRYDRRAFG